MSILLVATRGAMPKPPWYERSTKQVPNYKKHIQNKTSPFPKTTLEIVEDVPGEKMAGMWGGYWKTDSSGKITIYFQASLWNALIRNGMEWEIVHTLQHEYMEANLSVEEARRQYPRKNPYVMAQEDEDIGGEQHEEVIRKLDGITENEYDSWLDKIERYVS